MTLFVLLPGLASLVLTTSSAAQAPPAQAPKERQVAKEDKEKGKKEKRVYTNDDLEAARTRPSAVQDPSARDVQPYTPPYTPPDTQPAEPAEPSESAPAAPELSPEEMRIQELEENIKSLDESAKSLLWQYLQSTDTQEIMRLKAEQQSVLEQLEQAKAELAQLKGETTGRPAPRRMPTPQPG